jgi:hypothetical protein
MSWPSIQYSRTDAISSRPSGRIETPAWTRASKLAARTVSVTVSG